MVTFLQGRVENSKELVPFRKKIFITVWLLTSKESYREAANLFGVEKSTINYIFHQICRLINECRFDLVKWPNHIKQAQTSNVLMAKYGFPNCIGFIDGTHIQIRAPHNNPVDFYNRKDTHSVVLQGICDDNLKFIDIFIGYTGRSHDGRIFRESPIYTRLNDLVLPEYHILGDSAYPLSKFVLTPFRDNGLLDENKIKYNTVHACARSCIERTYGILKKKFQRLKYLELNCTEDISIVISACCLLHNFIIEEEEVNNVADFHLHLEHMSGAEKRDYICNLIVNNQ